MNRLPPLRCRRADEFCRRADILIPAFAIVTRLGCASASAPITIMATNINVLCEGVNGGGAGQLTNRAGPPTATIRLYGVAIARDN
jgi:hypothetical protein